MRVMIFGMALMLMSAPSNAEVKEVRIGVQYGLVYLPVAVAEAQGFFAEEANKAGLAELKVTINRFSGSTAISDAFLSSNIDVGAWGVPALLLLWDVTKDRYDVHGLAALAAHPFILDQQAGDQISGRFRRGDRIAVPSSTSPQAILMRMAARRMHGAGQRRKSTASSLPCRTRRRPRHSSPAGRASPAMLRHRPSSRRCKEATRYMPSSARRNAGWRGGHRGRTRDQSKVRQRKSDGCEGDCDRSRRDHD